jgi:TRAP-type mannitol/chloroaromatic compound transport system permease small subunit
MTDPSPSRLTAKPLLGFWLLCAVTLLFVVLALFPSVLNFLAMAISALLRALGAVVPGADAASDAAFVGRSVLVLSALLVVPVIVGVALWLGGLGGWPAPPRLLRLCQQTVRILEGLVALIGNGAKWLALFLVLVVVTVVIQRYVFGASSAKLQELILYLHASLFMAMAAYAWQLGAHVRVDVLYERLSFKHQAGINLISALLFAGMMMAAIVWTSRGYVGLSWQVLEKSTETSGLPLVFLLKTLIPVTAWLMLIQAVSEIIKAGLCCQNMPRQEPADGAS